MTWQPLRSLLTPPRFEADPVRTRRAQLLYTIVLVMDAFLLLVGILLPPLAVMFRVPPVVTAIAVGFLTVSLLLLFALQRGQIAGVGAVISVAAVVAALLVAPTQDGILDDVNYIMVLAVFLTGFVAGSRPGYGMAVITTLALAVIYALEWRDVGLGLRASAARPVSFLVLVLTQFLAAALVQFANRTQDEALARMADSNRALEQTRQGLETRVSERTQALERRAAYLQAAAEVGRAIATYDNLEQLLSQVTYLISAQYGFYHVGIFLLDEDGDYAVLRASNSSGGERMLNRQHRLRVGEQGIVGYVTGFGQPRIALDVGADAVFFNNPDLPDTRSEMALPLRAGGAIIGALDVQSVESNAFTPDDIQALQTLADQVSVAITNVRLLQRLQSSLEAERRAYGEASRAGWEAFLQTRETLGYRANADGDILPIAAGNQPPTTAPAALAHHGDPLPRNGATAELPVRLRGGEVAGVIRLRKPAGEVWTQDELALMETMTDQLAVALEAARLYNDTQRRAARERLIGDVASSIRETLDIDTMLQAAAREIGERLKLARVEVRLASQPTEAPTTESSGRFQTRRLTPPAEDD